MALALGLCWLPRAQNVTPLSEADLTKRRMLVEACRALAAKIGERIKGRLGAGAR